jgi:hypothetical protein
MKTKSPKYVFDPENFLSSASTLLNCSLTDNPFCAYEKGKYYFFVGDSQSGKSFFTMCAFAEASIDPAFDDYTFIHDNTEDGVLFDVDRYFGKKVAKRLRAPAVDENGEPCCSAYIEDFYKHAKAAFRRGPTIYILDSIDALTSRQEEKKEEAQEKEAAAGKKVTGEMSDGKAKINSKKLRSLIRPMKQSGSILIIVVQTRDNLGMTFSEKTRSGGRALKFYATSEIWTSVIKTLTKEVRGKKRKYGIITRMDVKKNRHTDFVGQADIPIIAGYGFDDIGGCVDWLVENEHWNKGKKITAPEFSEVPLGREKLIQTIEETKNGHYRLQELVGEVWNELRESLKPKRKPRYE